MNEGHPKGRRACFGGAYVHDTGADASFFGSAASAQSGDTRSVWEPATGVCDETVVYARSSMIPAAKAALTAPVRVFTSSFR
jgi:hypothetical protein